MNRKQKEFDFSRARQLALIRSADLIAVEVDGRKVSPAAMKAVLMAVDSRCGKSGRCFASAATLAGDCGLSRRTVQRALDGLRRLQLLVEEKVRRGRSTVIFRRICFANLVDFERIDTIGADADESGADAGDESVHGATGALSRRNQDRSRRNQRTFTAQRLRPKGKEGQIEESVKGKTASPSGFLNLFPGEKISEYDLRKPAFLERVYRRCVDERGFKDAESVRLTIYGFGLRCFRKRRQLREAVGWFVMGVGNRSYEWLLKQVDDEHDREAARNLIKHMQRGPDPPKSDLAAVDADAAFFRERDRQLAALAAAVERGDL